MADNQGSDRDPLNGLRVSLDTGAINIAAQKGRLRAIEPDGVLSYEER